MAVFLCVECLNHKLWELNELINIKCLALLLAYSKSLLNVHQNHDIWLQKLFTEHLRDTSLVLYKCCFTAHWLLHIKRKYIAWFISSGFHNLSITDILADNSLLWGAALSIVGCLAASRLLGMSTTRCQQHHPSPHLWQPRMPPDIAQCLLEAGAKFP